MNGWPRKSKSRLAYYLALVVILGSQSIGQTGANSHPNVVKDAPYDTSSWLELLAAAQAGGGVSASQPSAYAGVKLGLPVHFGKFDPRKPEYTFTLGLDYDRLQAHSGFSTELSAMLPIWRYPKPQEDDSKNFLRIYAEPGAGYRAGGGPFGGYASAKAMFALFSDKRLDFSKSSPYLEIERRFPVDAPLQGDTRVAIGLMIALCNHCGLD